jgi:hypothetical protein
VIRSTPSYDKNPYTPTPAPRRRRTVSRDPSIGYNSPLVGQGGLRKPQSSPSKQRRQTASKQPAGLRLDKAPNTTVAVSDVHQGGVPDFGLTSGQFLDASKATPKAADNTLGTTHLPTPRQPISTGSCPNTISETLAETHQRTAAQFRYADASPVPGVDSGACNEDIFTTSDTFQKTLAGSGGMLSPAFLSASLNFDAIMNAEFKAAGLATPVSLPSNPAVVDSSPGSASADSLDARASSLQTSLLNTSVQVSSVGYTVAVSDDSATPLNPSEVADSSNVFPAGSQAAGNASVPALATTNDTASCLALAPEAIMEASPGSTVNIIATTTQDFSAELDFTMESFDFNGEGTFDALDSSLNMDANLDFVELFNSNADFDPVDWFPVDEAM